MTELWFTTMRASASVPQDSSVPILDDAGAGRLTPQDTQTLGSDSGAPPLMDRAATVAPYAAQDRYDRSPAPTEVAVAIMDNGLLRAVFLTGLGGRLWSLRDLRTGRELLHTPPVVQPGNLGLRNAWFAGGVEWNLGFTGHWPLTCAPVFAGRVVAADGSPVLRMWEYERMLGLTWRIDAWLPPGSDRLFVRPVVANPTDTTVPVYWWSNVAVPLVDTTRVLTPATHAWHFGYGHGLTYLPVDDSVGRPATAPRSADYFFDLGHPTTPWICAVDGTGEGLLQVSTARLHGRKLFVWGTGPGGRHWQRWLGAEAPSMGYAEIQAGLGRTQLEHLALPPGERWAWTEAYGPLASPSAAGARLDEATGAVSDIVHSMSATLHDADRRLDRLTDTAPADVAATATGWGALEEAAGHRRPDPATPYAAATLGPKQQPWLELVRDGRLTDVAASPVLGAGWRNRLDRAPATAATAYHLGLQRWAAGERAAAVRSWNDAAARISHPLVHRALALAAQRDGDPAGAAEHYRRAVGGPIEKGDATGDIAIEALRAFIDAEDPSAAEELVRRLPRRLLGRGRVRYLRCRLALLAGDLDTVRRLLVDDALVVPDLREGDQSLDALWAGYCTAAGVDLPLPAHYDFRMRAVADADAMQPGQETPE